MFNSLQAVVNDLQQQQERLLDTAANISHELGVNQDHVKVIFKMLAAFLLITHFPVRHSTLVWTS